MGKPSTAYTRVLRGIACRIKFCEWPRGVLLQRSDGGMPYRAARYGWQLVGYSLGYDHAIFDAECPAEA